jgi:hypothetical protein
MVYTLVLSIALLVWISGLTRSVPTPSRDLVKTARYGSPSHASDWDGGE